MAKSLLYRTTEKLCSGAFWILRSLRTSLKFPDLSLMTSDRFRECWLIGTIWHGCLPHFGAFSCNDKPRRDRENVIPACVRPQFGWVFPTMHPRQQKVIDANPNWRAVRSKIERMRSSTPQRCQLGGCICNSNWRTTTKMRRF